MHASRIIQIVQVIVRNICVHTRRHVTTINLFINKKAAINSKEIKEEYMGGFGGKRREVIELHYNPFLKRKKYLKQQQKAQIKSKFSLNLV